MRIEITAETPEEKTKLAEPWIRSGVIRFALAGRMDPKESDFEFGFVHGHWPEVKQEIARIASHCDAIEAERLAVNAVLKAHNVLAEQLQSQQMLQKARNGAARIMH